MRVAFLDLEGVLSNLNHCRTKAMDLDPISLDPKNIAALNELVAWTKAKLVINSPLRYRFSMTELRRILRGQGVDADILDYTPELLGHERYVEIQTWLDLTTYPIEGFVIFEDHEMGPLNDHLVRTGFSTGLTHEDVEKAVRILQEQVFTSSVY